MKCKGKSPVALCFSRKKGETTGVREREKTLLQVIIPKSGRLLTSQEVVEGRDFILG